MIREFLLHRSQIVFTFAAISYLPACVFGQKHLTAEPPPATQPFVPQLIAQKIDGGYAVVISKATQSDPDWAKVVSTLQQKYGSQVQVFTWDKSVDETQPALSKMLPHFTCFVAKSTEASREFVAQIHRLTRNLNDDPYPDTIWGILTGLDVTDALRIAQTSTPLEIHNVCSTTGVHSEYYDSVFTVSDGKMGSVFQQGPSAKSIIPPDGVDTDRAHSLADAIHAVKPDLLVTSAHAGERVLEMPYSHGVFLGSNGKVIALPTTGSHNHMQLSDHGWELSSPNPKVWLAAGNCLIGHIDSNNSMALAMMHSAGVTQMVGYTVTTWFGAGGWGTLDWFQSQPGRYTMAESFLINDVAMTHRLATEFPGRERYAVKVYNDEDLGSLEKELGEPFPTDKKKAEDLLGLTWDHDVVAFYGDPAWSARISPHACDFDQLIKQDGNTFTLEIHATHDRSVKAFAFLPTRIKSSDYQSSGDAKDALLTDGYILADFGHLKDGQTMRETFSIRK
jgi:hypothetical protein